VHDRAAIRESGRMSTHRGRSLLQPLPVSTLLGCVGYPLLRSGISIIYSGAPEPAQRGD
jgi:hypothetical protein